MAALALGLALAAPAARAQPAGRGEDDSAGLVEDGRRALRAGDYADAVAALDQAIALNPRRVEAYVLRAAVDAARKDYRRGIATLRRAQALAPDSLDVLAALGVQLVLAGDADAGVPLLEQAVAQDPRRFEAQRLLGERYAAARRWREAAAALEAYLAHRPAGLAAGDEPNQVRLAEALLRLRRPAEAATLYRQAVRARPEDPAARLGLAWALAATDCRAALRALTGVADLAAAHPEVDLVRGQCLLAIGDAPGALAAADAYRAGVAAAAGQPLPTVHGLEGDAAAALGDLPRAAAALARAVAAEPDRRRWSLRLAAVHRRAGDGGAAVAELERLGPPATPAEEPAWWRELGEALLVAGEPAAVAARLAPALAALPDDAALAAIAGEAALRAGDLPAARTLLERATVAGDARGRRWLARAMAGEAAAALARDDLAAAEPLLVRADELAPGADPAVLLDLGVVRLALGRAADAVAPLERALAATPTAAAWHALARARAASGAAGAVEQARAAFGEAAALARGTPAAVQVALDRASLELEAGAAQAARAALDGAAGAAQAAGGAVAAAHRAALVVALHAQGLAALRDGAPPQAVALLAEADALAGGADLGVRCDLALATVASGERGAALKRLKALAKVACPFPAPADTQAVPLLTAFVDSLAPGKAGAGLARLDKLAGRAEGPMQRLAAAATRVVALAAAREAYDAGRLERARDLVGRARRAETRVAADELALADAVLAVAEGTLDDAVAALERLAPRLPEALVSLGVAADRRGDGAAALRYWREARSAGVEFDRLDDWIAAKQRLYGKEGP